MEQLVQCPVCTLFLHNGMTLESHLDTHPKDQVIKALCTLSANNGFGSRTSTPMHSERSYRSRSRTPADESPRWSGSHRSIDNERYWRRTPSRSSKTPVSSITRNPTPTDVRIGDINFENSSNNNSSNHYPGLPFMKTDKSTQPFIQNMPVPEFDQQYMYYPDQQDDKEIKYSRSAEYSAIDSNNVFTYNIPPLAPAVKLQSALIPSGSRRNSNLVKLLPKPNNIMVKTNMGGMQYINPGVKPVHLMVPTAPTFVQKNVQSNMIVSGSIPTSQILETKACPLTTTNSQFSQLTSGTFTPGTTVVTQNSQIIYREMVHNIDGKPFISSMPAVLSNHDNITNVAGASSMYQNVMVVDQFGNTSCMYTTPQQILSKPCGTPIYGEVSMSNLEKSLSNNLVSEANKTLIIEVSPIVTPAPMDVCPTTHASQTSDSNSQPTNSTTMPEKLPDRNESRNGTPGPSKGLKILSNIKVEVPVQHHKNLLNTVVDLTGSHEPEYPDRSNSPERILPDFDDNNHSLSGDCMQPSVSNDSVVSNTFSVIKNVGNPPSYKDSISKSSVVDNKIENEFSDSCPIPDLICKEKPSISPCSELSENGDNSNDIISIPPKAEIAAPPIDAPAGNSKPTPQKPHRSAPLRLNNIFVKKHKKILEIKNSKTYSVSPCSSKDVPARPATPVRPPENFTMNKIHTADVHDNKEKRETLQTVTVEVFNESKNHQEFDVDTEEQSMDIEPVALTNISHSNQYSGINMVHVKEEINTSNEGGFSNGTGTSERDLTPLESMRPINVISYGSMAADDFDDESNHKELLELEAASKNKQFVNMMNENYFGDNIYADYFTPDRVESFNAARDTTAFPKDGPKDGMYMWGEPSQKESEFVLPNFIHESYKIAESSGVEYVEMGVRAEAEACERDSKADVLSDGRSEGEAPLDICADERMPPRGELSGQESNGDMESPWSGMYTEVTPAEPYDLIARESWVSDGSEMDPNEKQDNLEDGLQAPKPRQYSCAACRVKFASLKEMRAHRAAAHGAHAAHRPAASYSRLVTARAIKKEAREDLPVPGAILPSDSKEAIASSMLQAYETIEAKPPLEALIKQEPRRRRRDFVCPTCKQDQGSEAAFHDHLKLHPLECLTCGKCFFRRANLALHIKTHLGIKNFKCDVCEKRFLTRQKLMEHHNTHTGRAPFKCSLCNDSFRRYSNLVQHRDRHHFHKKSKVRDFVCQCGAVFHSRAKLRWHRETHDGKPKACLYCSDKFVHAASLTRHVRRSHDEYYLGGRRQENVPCPVCKQVYLRTNLRAHMLTHSGQRPFSCFVCNKAFTTKWNLKLHRWTHMSRSAKPYKCTLCKGAFIRQTEYISHMNAHKSVRPYTCNYCGCQFIRKYNCQRHVREHETAKKYVCKVRDCGKSFHRSYYLSEHMKVHSGARPFSCNICGKMSGNKSNHNKHVKIHHAREPVASEA